MKDTNSKYTSYLLILISLTAGVYVVDKAIDVYVRWQVVKSFDGLISKMNTDTHASTRYRVVPASPYKYPLKKKAKIKTRSAVVDTTQDQGIKYEIIDLKTPYIRWQ